jgi:hypothetical protein
MMRRATAAVRSSGKGAMFINFCLFQCWHQTYEKWFFLEKFISMSAEYANYLVPQCEYAA